MAKYSRERGRWNFTRTMAFVIYDGRRNLSPNSHEYRISFFVCHVTLSEKNSVVESSRQFWMSVASRCDLAFDLSSSCLIQLYLNYWICTIRQVHSKLLSRF